MCPAIGLVLPEKMTAGNQKEEKDI